MVEIVKCYGKVNLHAPVRAVSNIASSGVSRTVTNMAIIMQRESTAYTIYGEVRTKLIPKTY